MSYHITVERWIQNDVSLLLPWGQGKERYSFDYYPVPVNDHSVANIIKHVERELPPSWRVISAVLVE